MISDKEILAELKSKYPDEIEEVFPFPKSYPENVQTERLKAIYLGCDPSNNHTNELSYVFALGSTPPIFKAFVTVHTNQLKAIGLEWEDVFVQNLCRNYFKKETSKNISVWKRIAKEYWIEKFRAELDELKIPDTVPVLLSSIYLYDVLVTDKEWKNMSAPEFYTCEVDIPVPADKNLLNRPLIPLYRGKSRVFPVSYYLKNEAHWAQYINQVKSVLKN